MDRAQTLVGNREYDTVMIDRPKAPVVTSNRWNWSATPRIRWWQNDNNYGPQYGTRSKTPCRFWENFSFHVIGENRTEYNDFKVCVRNSTRGFSAARDIAKEEARCRLAISADYTILS